MPFDAGIGLGCGWTKLEFDMEYQKKSNWCWAATAVSVSKFFNRNCVWTQCSLVNAVLGMSDCCSDRSDKDCDLVGYLEDALKSTNNFVSCIEIKEKEEKDIWKLLRQEILEGRPLCAHIAWTDGGGHFVVITGIRLNLSNIVDSILVSDPWYGTSEVVFEHFRTHYQAFGTWDDAFCVCPVEGDC